MIRTVRATQYVTALREGGSLPAIIEADDLGLYVLKFRGAGQGPLALVAELIAGEIGRALGLNIPELVLVEVDAALGRNEPDEEIRDLLRASVGLNLALDYLPGSSMFDPAAGDTADPRTASLAVWFDAFVVNVDRTARNANLLCWHRESYFIDHGAALYFHHDWQSMAAKAESAFAQVKEHILLPWASELNEADAIAHKLLTPEVFARILEEVPEAWLLPEAKNLSAAEKRAVYLDFFTRRLNGSSNLSRRRSVPVPSSFDYAVVRVVPRVERGEFINAGVVVFCLEHRFLAARVQVDEARLKALWPDVDIELVRQHLEAIPRICAGDASAGPIARLSQRERFHWLVSPRSTIIQMSPVHSGLCAAPEEAVEQLSRRFMAGSMGLAAIPARGRLDRGYRLRRCLGARHPFQA